MHSERKTVGAKAGIGSKRKSKVQNTERIRKMRTEAVTNRKTELRNWI